MHHHAQAVLAVHNAVARMVALLHRDYNVRWLGLVVVKCTMGCGGMKAAAAGAVGATAAVVAAAVAAAEGGG